MPSLSPVQRQAALRRFASRRTPISVIVATLGKLTADELIYYRRQQGILELQASVKADGPASAADRVHASVARHSLVEWRECADMKRRKRLEKNPVAWLRWYGREAFTRRFDRPHKEMIHAGVYACETGGRLVVGAERGTGKSSVFDWLGLYFALTGKRLFPVILPWDSSMMAETFGVWKAALCDNDRLLDDYPEFCRPFEKAEGTPQRLAAQHWKGGPFDGDACGARLQVGAGRIIFPNCRGGIGGKSINGSPRGLKLPLSDGRILRPDLILIDEPQDDQVAISKDLVGKTARKINGAVAGMGQAGESIPMLMVGNFIASNDVMDTYAHDPNWRCIRVACVERWPIGWADKGPIYKLWEQWWMLFREHADGRKQAAALYRKNKDKMRKGMKISAPNAYRKHITRQLTDVYAAVMRRYWQDGHEAFMAERQQVPVSVADNAQLKVTSEIIIARAIGPKRGVSPEGTIKIVVGADINPGISGRLGARITWVATAFQMYQSSCVIGYGIHKLDMPKNPTPSQQVSSVYAGLNAVRMQLGPWGCETLIYDARGWYNKGVTRGQALRYAHVPLAGTNIRAIPAEGWSSLSYRPTHKTAIRQLEGCHVSRDRIEQATVEWVAWDADWFNLMVLKGWLATPGAPGGCIMYSGDHDSEFVAQVTTRSFMGMVQKHNDVSYDWARAVGNDDYGDCLAMCRVGAAYGGIGTGGQVKITSGRKKYTQKDLRR